MRMILVACIGLLWGVVAAAQTVGVAGFEIDLGNGARVILSPNARITYITLNPGEITTANGGAIARVEGVTIERNALGMVTQVGNASVDRNGLGAVTSIGSIRIRSNHQGIVTAIGNASVNRNGAGLVTSVTNDPRVRLFVGGDGWR